MAGGAPAAQGKTFDAIVHDEHQRQGASNVTVRKHHHQHAAAHRMWIGGSSSRASASSMRPLRAGSDFAAMDFRSRDLYRRAIEQLARGSNRTELEIARAALAAAGKAVASRQLDPGYYLIAAGRRASQPRSAIGLGMERVRPIQHGARRRRLHRRHRADHPSCLAVPLLVLHAGGIAGLRLAVLALLGLIPFDRCGVALVNRAAMMRSAQRPCRAWRCRVASRQVCGRW